MKLAHVDFRTIATTACSLCVAVLTVSMVSMSASEAQDAQHTWTISEILSERQAPDNNRTRYCNGSLFKPCVCARDVTNYVQFRPSVKECGKRAAIILSGKYLSVFSVVVRDIMNRDRWPAAGVNNCTPYERDTLGLNKCSVFKVQKIIEVANAAGDAEVHCLGASGYSKLFAKVTRITAKLSDIPNSNQDPLVRWCIPGPTLPLN